MQAYWTLTRRELGAYFMSLTGYIIIAAATFLVGMSFVELLEALQQRPTVRPVTEVFYDSYCFWLVLLLTTPVITMRLFALERFSGTFETLMTTPVTELQVVLAKFTSALMFYLVMWLPLLGCILLVRHFTNDTTSFDTGSVASTFLGVFLLGGLFISIGCCASALTRSQVAAGMISLLAGATLFLVAYLAFAKKFPSPGDWQGQVLATFGLFDQMRDFVRGIIDTRAIVLLVSLTGFFLFLTLRIIESRRWR